ncbi:hypothetical protein FQZ97_850200 [compost metagenome]
MVEPSPSSEITRASTVVPTTIFSGSPFTARRMRPTMGSNRPASIMTPKYRMANISITPVGAILRIPSSIILSMPAPNPPSRAKIMGTRMSATRGDRRLVMISVMNVITMPKPSRVNSMRLSPTRRCYARLPPAGEAGPQD